MNSNRYDMKRANGSKAQTQEIRGGEYAARGGQSTISIRYSTQSSIDAARAMAVVRSCGMGLMSIGGRDDNAR